MRSLLGFAWTVVTLPWSIGRDLLAPDHELDKLIEYHRQLFLDQHEGQ